MPVPTRILLFGGTFDPPHIAHLQLPALVAKRLGCEQIIYIPAARNPLKNVSPSISDAERLALLRAAVSGVPAAIVDSIELDRGGSSYFIDTVKSMRERFGDEAKLYFLIGADQVLSFHRWKDWQRILELAEPVVMLRPPWDLPAYLRALAKEYGEFEAAKWIKWTQTDLPLIDVSATELRAALREGADPGHALPDKLLSYIRKHGLYQNSERARDRAARPTPSSESAEHSGSNGSAQ